MGGGGGARRCPGVRVCLGPASPPYTLPLPLPRPRALRALDASRCFRVTAGGEGRGI